MDVADQLEQIRVFFDENRLEAILEQVAAAAVAAVEDDGVAGEHAAHDGGEGRTAGAQEQVEVVRHEAPGEQARAGGLDAAGEALEKLLSIAVMLEDDAAFDTAGDHVVQSVGSIEARAARHRGHAYGDADGLSRGARCSVSTNSEHSDLRVCEEIS